MPSSRPLAHGHIFLIWLQFSSVTQLCPTLCDPMNHSTPGLPVITNSQSPPKPMSIESVMPSNHLILCRPLLLLPSIFPSIRVFSKESALRIRWPNYWSFSFNIRPSNEQFLKKKIELDFCHHKSSSCSPYHDCISLSSNPEIRELFLNTSFFLLPFHRQVDNALFLS